jgi:hypothetical protein
MMDSIDTVIARRLSEAFVDDAPACHVELPRHGTS